MSRPARDSVGAETAHPLTAPGTELLLISPYCSLSVAFGVQRRGYADRDGESFTDGTQQSAMWSSTIPVACINA